MPYIAEHLRYALDPEPDTYASTSGELNYQITRLLLGYLHQHGLSYSTINDIRGAVVNAGDEFYRRIAAPYEDEKIEENGDVYPCD